MTRYIILNDWLNNVSTPNNSYIITYETINITLFHDSVYNPE